MLSDLVTWWVDFTMAYSSTVFWLVIQPTVILLLLKLWFGKVFDFYFGCFLHMTYASSWLCPSHSKETLDSGGPAAKFEKQPEKVFRGVDAEKASSSTAPPHGTRKGQECGEMMPYDEKTKFGKKALMRMDPHPNDTKKSLAKRQIWRDKLGYHSTDVRRQDVVEDADDPGDSVRLENLRKGATVHRALRKKLYAKDFLQSMPETTNDIIEQLEGSLRDICKKMPEVGHAFPTGVSVNEIAAHDSINPSSGRVQKLRKTDLVKLDYGISVHGHILDCAFSFTWDDGAFHKGLMETAKEATEMGIRCLGADARLSEIGAAIHEVFNAGEVFWPNGKVFPVKVIKNLNGHLIRPYRIHAGKMLAPCDTGTSQRVYEGELWAIETFSSYNGIGWVSEMPDSIIPCSHFMINPDVNMKEAMSPHALTKSARDVLQFIDKKFQGMAFCPRWMDKKDSNHPNKPPIVANWADNNAGLDELCTWGMVTRYPPLVEIPGAYTAQYEHTVLVKSMGKEVLTRGWDY